MAWAGAEGSSVECLDDDLRELVSFCIETEKRAVCEDLDEYYAAFAILVFPSGRKVLDVEFADEDEKISAYRQVVQTARRLNATAIVTINSGFVSAEPWSKEHLDGYWWGRLAEEVAKDCISITVSGPNMPSYGIDLNYEIMAGKVHFEPEPEVGRTIIGFLADWPSESPSAPN